MTCVQERPASENEETIFLKFMICLIIIDKKHNYDYIVKPWGQKLKNESHFKLMKEKDFLFVELIADY